MLPFAFNSGMVKREFGAKELLNRSPDWSQEDSFVWRLSRLQLPMIKNTFPTHHSIKASYPNANTVAQVIVTL
ncbi:hypothetical protein CEP54_014100 [Fusarium duplospermum]|uniref:Uncharacterized protein n=1 Tax=Fusarium duplospermum TaxID=1325734 RepID=A0A428NYD8_9HYPO|nr:hypothetical protein CEP54_014100 [Fusarium duplospermum]